MIKTEKDAIIEEFEDCIKQMAETFPKELKAGMIFYFGRVKTFPTSNARMTTLSNPEKAGIDTEFANLDGKKSKFSAYKVANITLQSFLFLKT
jgi:hypothetical protein